MSNDGITDPLERPYRGIKTFTEEYKDSFYGRKLQVEELNRLIQNNRLTVIYGKSGIGKSSLINAGLIPALRKSFFLPILIRIRFDDLTTSPVAFVIQRTLEEIKKVDPDAAKKLTDTSNPDITLWEFFRSLKILGGILTPALIFDQFEEYFSIGRNYNDAAHGFITQLSDLVEQRIPGQLKDRDLIESVSGQENNFRVIISLREDFLSELEDVSKLIPSLNKTRFRIQKLKGQEAFDAVYEPARHLIDKKDVEVILNKIIDSEVTKSPNSFSKAGKMYNQMTKLLQTTYGQISSTEERSNEGISNLLTSAKAGDKVITWYEYEFEPYILSLFCFQVNEKRLSKPNQPKITSEIIGAVQVVDIVETYYDETLASLEKQYHNSGIKQLLESELISGDGYRLLKPLSDKGSFSHLPAKIITELENARIIRRESRNQLTFIELSHDLIAKVVAAQKKKSDDYIKYYERWAASRKKRVRLIIYSMVGVFIAALIALSYYYFSNIIQQRNVLAEQNSEIKNNDQKIQLLNDSLKDVIAKYDIILGRITSPSSGAGFPNLFTAAPVGASGNDTSKSTVFVQVSNKAGSKQVQRCASAMHKLNFNVPGIEVVNKSFKNSIRYFHPEDKSDAQLIKNICDQLYDVPFSVTQVSLKAPVGQLELWVNYEPYYQQLFSSKEQVRKEAAAFMVNNYKKVDTAKVWPEKMIETAIGNPGNQNGIYNVLVVLNAMDAGYLRGDYDKISKWINSIDPGIADNSETQKVLNKLRSKIDASKKLNGHSSDQQL